MRINDHTILNRKNQKGVSLIEILVTTLVLGIGLLGVGSLQVSSISSNQEGFFTSQATSIAEDLSSRIRTSKVAEMMSASLLDHTTYIANYTQTGPYTCAAAPTLYCRSNAGALPDPKCTDGTTDLADLSTFDKWDICKIAENTLPGGKVRALGSGGRVSIVVEWDATKAREDLGQETNVNVNCGSIVGDSEKACIILEILP